jgi:hypothetical protein
MPYKLNVLPAAKVLETVKTVTLFIAAIVPRHNPTEAKA